MKKILLITLFIILSGTLQAQDSSADKMDLPVKGEKSTYAEIELKKADIQSSFLESKREMKNQIDSAKLTKTDVTSDTQRRSRRRGVLLLAAIVVIVILVV